MQIMLPGVFMEPGTARLYHIISRNAMISVLKSRNSLFSMICPF